MPEATPRISPDRSPLLRAFNLVLVTICVMSLVAVTIMLIVMIWSNDSSESLGRLMATTGLVLTASLLGLVVNAIVGKSLGVLLAKICWAASWLCIFGGSVIGGVAIWLHVDHEEVLLRTIGTITVLFVASMIGTALAGTLANAMRADGD
ncbi:MAG: hypothetical protein ACYSUU_02705 [Planctomycetota bacterium]|jgi:hypothetical protein